MMTEEEAKTKWCPFARVGSVSIIEAGATNRIIGSDGNLRWHAACCVASECSAWRWQQPATETRPVWKTLAESRTGGWVGPPEKDEGWTVQKDLPDKTVWERPWPTTRTGYCGLSEPRVAEVEHG